VQEMKVSKVPTLRVKNTRNLKHEGKWDPFLSAVVCTWRRKGFPPSYPTFPSKAFQAGGIVDRIQLIPRPVTASAFTTQSWDFLQP